MLPLTYEIKTSPVKGAPTFAVAVCNDCKKPGEVKVQANRHHNPEMVAKLFRAAGWKFDHNRQRKCICAACMALKHPRINPEETEDMAAKTAPAPLVKDIPEAEKPYHGITPPKTPRDLTPATKTKVRQMLDGHFDEAKGMYLEGYSDQRIGKELNIPWACVTQMREAAYGPILVDTEVENLRAKVKAMSDNADALEDTIKNLEQDAKVARSRLAEVRQEGLALFEMINHVAEMRKAS